MCLRRRRSTPPVIGDRRSRVRWYGCRLLPITVVSQRRPDVARGLPQGMRSKVVVVGDTGLIGRQVCGSLVRRNIPFSGVSRGELNVSWPHEIWSPTSKNVDDAGRLADATFVFVCIGSDGGLEYKRRNSYRILIDTIQAFSAVFGALPTDHKCGVIICSSIQAEAPSFDRDHVYGITKKLVEDMIAAINLASDTLKVSAARLGQVFGSPDSTGLRRGRLIPTWARQILNGREPELTDCPGTKVELLWNADVGEWLVEMSLSPIRLPTTIDFPDDLRVRLTLEELSGIMKKVCGFHVGAIDMEPDEFERRLLEVVRWVDATNAISGPGETPFGA